MNDPQQPLARGTLTSLRHDLFAALLLVMAGAAVRLLLRDLPNFAPVAGIALFAGFFLQRFALALMVPIMIMFVSDQLLGGYDMITMLAVYGMLAMPVVLRPVLRKLLCQRSKPAWLVGGSLLGISLGSSLAFFLVTNLSVWIQAVSGTSAMAMYDASLAGLVTCYLQALPFFRYTLAGDLCFTVSLFGGWGLAMQLLQKSRSAQLAVDKH
jgi:hypothetical protein